MTTRPDKFSKSDCQPRIPEPRHARWEPPAMVLIGIDPHKSTHTATAVEPEANRDRASIRIDVTLPEYQRMLDWTSQWPQRQWAIENADGMGRHMASWLLARGEQVVDVSPAATA